MNILTEEIVDQLQMIEITNFSDIQQTIVTVVVLVIATQVVIIS